MTPSAGKRRRRWGVMAAALAMLVGAPLAWQFRPLNAVERQLVGVWQTPSLNEHGSYIILGADRGMAHGIGRYDPAQPHAGLWGRSLRGKWSATGTAFRGRWHLGVTKMIRNLWDGQPNSFGFDIEFEESDVLRIRTGDGRDIRWTRLSNQTPDLNED